MWELLSFQVFFGGVPALWPEVELPPLRPDERLSSDKCQSHQFHGKPSEEIAVIQLNFLKQLREVLRFDASEILDSVGFQKVARLNVGDRAPLDLAIRDRETQDLFQLF